MEQPECFSSSVWPGNREKAQLVSSARTPLPVRSSWKQGHTFKFSLKWLFQSYTGLVYVQTYLWLMKDWSWSQLRWFYPAIIFGSVALISGLGLVFIALWYRIYSEAATAFGLLLWLTGNYWWMIGEIWGYKITLESPSIFVPEVFHEEDGSDIFYDNNQKDTQVIATIAVIWLFCTQFIAPFFWYDRDNRVLAAVTEECPRYRFHFFFRDFIEYENFHIFFWAFKDMFWAYDNFSGYFPLLLITIAAMTDAIYLTATTSGHFVDLIHYISLMFWVLANGFWATGELVIEGPREDDIPDGGYENYTFVPVQMDVFEFFWGRNLGGWCYFISVAIIIVFYIDWIFFATIESEPEKGAENATSEKGYENRTQNPLFEIEKEGTQTTPT